MPKKKSPYILLCILLLVLFFIFGVRYGQRVEKTNKIVNVLLSIPPSRPPISPTPVEYKTYEHKGCGVSFLYPSSLSVEKESSREAKLAGKTSEYILLMCDEAKKLEPSITSLPQQTSFAITSKDKKQITIFTLSQGLMELVKKTIMQKSLQ